MNTAKKWCLKTLSFLGMMFCLPGFIFLAIGWGIEEWADDKLYDLRKQGRVQQS